MQDAFAYCTELVRQADHDRYLAALFAPEEARGAFAALYAFNVEIARVRELAREPLPGEIRLQWWTDVLNGERRQEAEANPVAAALLTAVERYRLSEGTLADLVEARRFDLYDEPMPTVADLEAYTARTSSGLINLAAQILGADVSATARPAGLAYGLTGLARTFPLHAARRQLFVPADILERHDAHAHDIYAGRSTPAINAALAELRTLARRHLATAKDMMPAVPSQALPPFLSVALVRSSLDRLDSGDAFAPTELAPWRRQWLIWRAARNPARIAR
ncbi:MAG TPA: phytoene/squalene synthase family protein [Xanthobacteraceae bacterium]|jgi:phytoene synthase|nr:phytoene/squalene synthase family protein [Xanthobacteraceae bacterium]